MRRRNREFKLKGMDCGDCGKRFLEEEMKMHLECCEEEEMRLETKERTVVVVGRRFWRRI